MIHNPYALVGILILVEAAVLCVAEHQRFIRYFRYIPAVFWMYFLPMLLSTFRFIDSQSFVFPEMTKWLLPVSLFLILLSVDLSLIKRIGKLAFLLFFAGSFGIMLGTVISFLIFKPWVGEEFWSSFAALAASWMGGSANFVAVKEALGTPDSVFLPMVIVDTILPYLWMGVLVVLSAWQAPINQQLGASQSLIDGIQEKLSNLNLNQARVHYGPITFIIVICGFALSLAAGAISSTLPVIPGVVSSFTWIIIIVSISGLVLSVKTARLASTPAVARIGYFLLYFVLTTIGARAGIEHLHSSLMLLLAGCVIIIIHAGVLLLAVKWLRAPISLGAISSQANIGGAASAPIVAEIYHPGFSTLGILMAILGNIAGTYLGIITGQICLLMTKIF